MADHRLLTDPSLLSLCAILRWFDRDLLTALLEHMEDDCQALLASDLVVPSARPAGAYQLREDTRADELARLRSDRPLDELTLHTRAFEHFLARMERPDSTLRRADDEDACFYHLGELRLLLTDRREWQIISQYVERAGAAHPAQPQHLYQLALYDGFVAIRTQDYDRGEAILTALLGQSDLAHETMMLGWNFLAQGHWFQSRYDRALTSYQRVHRLAGEIGNLQYQAIALLNMSMVYHEIGYYDQALELSLQSLQTFREIRDSYREAHSLYEIGHNALLLGRWQIAQQHLEDAIRLHESLGMVAGLAPLYWSLGLLHHMLDDPAQSEKAYRRTLEIAQSPEYGTPSVAMDTWLNLGFLYQTQARWDEALAAYERSVVVAQQVRNQHSLNLTHYRRGTVLARQGRHDGALAAYRQAIDGIESLRSATETEEIKIGLLGTSQQVYESMVLLCLELNRPAEAFEYVERARSRAFLDVLAKKSPELYDAFDQPIATLAEVQARLPAGSLLIEYFTTGVLPRGESLINQLPPENARLREHLALPPRTLIFGITRERFEVYDAALDPNTLRPQPGDPSPGRRLLRERLLAHLHERLIAPAEPLLRGRELLYLVPHGPLHYTPFAALRPHGGEPLLQAAGPAIALAPSATVLLRRCLGRPAAGARRGAPLLALGYDDQEGQPLRYAEAEARHVARLLGGIVLAGPEPKRDDLLALGPPARWLHFSGHAIYNPRDPLASELVTGAGESLSARAIIGELDLDADLVTLSACTSGVSRVASGDELLGLQRAFLYAGARSVLCTLWEAADFVALLLMDRFYADLRRGRAPAAALRDAQAALRAMTGRDVAATLERWRAEDPALVTALGDLPDIPPEQLDAQLYADPAWWAPFMLIGRAD